MSSYMYMGRRRKRILQVHRFITGPKLDKDRTTFRFHRRMKRLERRTPEDLYMRPAILDTYREPKTG